MMRIHSIMVVIAFICAPMLFAADVPDVFGMPKNVVIDGGLGVYLIWYDNGVWHMRTSTENSEGKRTRSAVVFTGTVLCDGKVSAKGVDLDSPKKDYITPHKDGYGFDFHFTTHGKTDQADFTVEGNGKSLKFKLEISGADALPSRILIGKNGSSPEKCEFFLPAIPKEKVAAATAVKAPVAVPKVPAAAAAKPVAPAGVKGKVPEDE